MKGGVNIREEGNKVMFDFNKMKHYFTDEKNERKVMPVTVQHFITKDVLFSAHVNPEALEYSQRYHIAAFWSLSRNEIWIKGLTSGSFLELIEVRVNCDQNSLLYLVVPVNGVGACHTKDEDGEYRAGCYYRKLSDDGETLEKIEKGGKKHETVV